VTAPAVSEFVRKHVAFFRTGSVLGLPLLVNWTQLSKERRSDLLNDPRLEALHSWSGDWESAYEKLPRHLLNRGWYALDAHRAIPFGSPPGADGERAYFHPLPIFGFGSDYIGVVVLGRMDWLNFHSYSNVPLWYGEIDGDNDYPGVATATDRAFSRIETALNEVKREAEASGASSDEIQSMLEELLASTGAVLEGLSGGEGEP